MRLMLTLVDGEEIEYVMEKDSVTIGRSAKCDLVIPHESMSRQHCKIEVKDGEIFITDLGSINGVLIDGKKIPANASVPFQTYLHLAFGYVTGAQLMVDEKTRLGILNPLDPKSASFSSSIPSSFDNKTKTKTRSLQAQKTGPIKAKAPASKGSEKMTLIFKGIAFVGVLIGLYFFLYADKEMSSTEVTPTEQRPEPKTTESTDHF
jgi:predicted component of type VI protein secretion system